MFHVNVLKCTQYFSYRLPTTLDCRIKQA
eukprot:SAG31_NODE_27314_length_428_cov_0.677812_1_plen_28_part_01